MDGGTESWAWSRERLTDNIGNIGAFLAQQNADFYLIQEVDRDSTRSYHVDETALLRETRLKTARTLLRGTTMHISEIAWSVGYPDALYFSRVFAASEGCSPSVYRAGQEHT